MTDRMFPSKVASKSLPHWPFNEGSSIKSAFIGYCCKPPPASGLMLNLENNYGGVSKGKVSLLESCVTQRGIFVFLGLGSHCPLNVTGA